MVGTMKFGKIEIQMTYFHHLTEKFSIGCTITDKISMIVYNFLN